MQKNNLFDDIVLFIKDILSDKYTSVGKQNVFLWAFLLLYIISPLDFIPDLFFGIGQVDDLVAITYFYFTFRGDFKDYRQWRKKELDNEKIIEIDAEEIE